MRILLCETDPVMLEATAALLESRGLSVTAAADVAELPPVAGYDVRLTNCREILSTGIPTVYMSQSQERCDEVAARGIPVTVRTHTREASGGRSKGIPFSHLESAISPVENNRLHRA